MPEVTRRERIRAETETEIRQHARVLLSKQGRDAVTLRAIARKLGITAPALYRYYNSREDLLRQLCDDICTELAVELNGHSDALENNHALKVFTVCREFRRWALAHPREFSLVFATPPQDSDSGGRGADQDQFTGVFLRIVGPLMAEVMPSERPDQLGPQVAAERDSLVRAFSSLGIEVPANALHSEAVYGLLRWWARLYGHVALEVFGRFPFDLTEADRLFDILLTELAQDIESHEPGPRRSWEHGPWNYWN